MCIAANETHCGITEVTSQKGGGGRCVCVFFFFFFFLGGGGGGVLRAEYYNKGPRIKSCWLDQNQNRFQHPVCLSTTWMLWNSGLRKTKNPLSQAHTG